MNENNDQPKNNLTAIAIGFLLIVFVTILFFLKSYFSNKKNENNLAQIQNQSQVNDLEKYSSISASDLLKKIENREKLKIIDIRETQSFSASHIVDSKNISLDTLKNNFPFSDKTIDYFIVDDFGFTPNEKQVIDIFSQNGFDKVFYLEGGINNWANAFNPLVGFGNPNSFTDQSKVTYIKSDELKNTISQEVGFLYIIDLRDKNSFQSGHLSGAVNISLDDLESQRRQIPLGKKIILYDDNGMKAFQGAVRLFDMGILNVFVLSDGLNTWKQKGFEVVK